MMKRFIYGAVLATIGLALAIAVRPINHIDAIETIDQSPFGRDGWRAMMRNGGVTKQQYAKAIKQVELDVAKERKRNFKDAGLAEWEDLGPGKFGGRVRALAFNPDNADIVWTGGVSGGLWKSTNGGNSWTPKALGQANFSITDILIHPNHPDTMYVSTGEGIIHQGANAVSDDNGGSSTPGNGIFRSYDGGNNWERVAAITDANEEEFFFVNVLEFDPLNPTIFYAGTTAKEPNGTNTAFGCATNDVGKAYRFSQNGDIVAEILNTSCLGGVTSIEVRDNGNHIFFGQQEGLSRWSFDGTVDELNGVGSFPNVTGRVVIRQHPNINTTFYALCEGDNSNFGMLYVTINTGLSWTNLNLTVEPFKASDTNNQGWYDMALWIDPLDDNRIIIGGIEIWESEDLGATFTKISDKDEFINGNSAHADCHTIVETSDYSASKRTVYFGTDGGVIRSANILNVAPTTTWQQRNGNSLNIAQFYSFDVLGDGTFTNIMGGAQDNGTLLFDEIIGTTEWERTGGGDGGFCRFGTDRKTLYYSRQNGRFFRKNHPDSTEWPIALLNGVPVAPGTTDISQPLAVCPGLYSPIITNDSANFITVMEVIPTDRDQIFIGAQRLWHSEDGGCSWSDVSPTPLVSGRNILSIGTNNQGTKIGIGYDNGDVWLGDIAGGIITWEPSRSYNAFFPVTSIAINSMNSDKIMISIGGYRDANIRYTNDGGVTWIFDRSDGVPELHVNKLLWHYSESSWIYAATDLGIYASEDNGANWEITPQLSLNSGPVFNEFTDLRWGATGNSGGRSLYAASYGRGIWKTDQDVLTDYYFDQDDLTSDEFGNSEQPFITVQKGEDIQAHGQTWHIDGGTYTTSGSVIIDKRIGEIQKTGIGSVIIGNN